MVKRMLQLYQNPKTYCHQALPSTIGIVGGNAIAFGTIAAFQMLLESFYRAGSIVIEHAVIAQRFENRLFIKHFHHHMHI
jgi:hypothetical protein